MGPPGARMRHAAAAVRASHRMYSGDGEAKANWPRFFKRHMDM